MIMKSQFAVVYQFEVIRGKEQEFQESWEKMTELIYMHEGSLGSRLHKEKEQTYIAYAQWPSREKWENYGKNMPKEAEAIGDQMRRACTKIETLFQLNTVSDLLRL